MHVLPEQLKPSLKAKYSLQVSWRQKTHVTLTFDQFCLYATGFYRLL